MLCFLRKTIISQTQGLITSISLTSLQQLSLQNSWISLKCISTSSNIQPFVVSYLINAYGFSPEKAASASKYLSFQTREKPDLVFEFFSKNGFSQTQILRLIRSYPHLLRYNPEKNFLPKIEYFKSKGILCSDLPKFITSFPSILHRSLERQIIPSFDSFKSLFQSEDKFIRALKRCPAILVVPKTCVLPNIKALRYEGVPELHIVKLFGRHPRVLTVSARRFKEIVAKVREMGFNPLTMRFVIAVATITCISKSTWTRKTDYYKRWGWSDSDILTAFGRFQQCMTLSEDKIEKTLEFFVNQMGCEPSTIARHPVLLGYSFNKRIIPRASVIQVLLSKGLVKRLNLNRMFDTSEEVFLEKFIMRHENEANELLKLCQAKMTVEQKNL